MRTKWDDLAVEAEMLLATLDVIRLDFDDFREVMDRAEERMQTFENLLEDAKLIPPRPKSRIGS